MPVMPKLAFRVGRSPAGQRQTFANFLSFRSHPRGVSWCVRATTAVACLLLQVTPAAPLYLSLPLRCPLEAHGAQPERVVAILTSSAG